MEHEDKGNGSNPVSGCVALFQVPHPSRQASATHLPLKLSKYTQS